MARHSQRQLCGSLDHLVGRRGFLGASSAAAAAFATGFTGLGALPTPVLGQELQKRRKRVLMIFLNGGASQFET